MKKILNLVAIVVVMAAIPASAGTVSFWYTPDYFTSPGGEFTVSLINAPDLQSYQIYYNSETKDVGTTTDPSFQSFCLEYNEHIYVNTGTPYQYDISDRAYYGGVDANGDPLSLGTAYLYALFTNGNLLGYNYDPNSKKRDDSAAELQAAIWFLEGEGGDKGFLTNNYKDLLIAQFGSIENAMKDNNGLFAVKVLNIKTTSGGLAQDQLIRVPDGGLTAMLLGVAIGSLALISRKFKL